MTPEVAPLGPGVECHPGPTGEQLENNGHSFPTSNVGLFLQSMVEVRSNMWCGM